MGLGRFRGFVIRMGIASILFECFSYDPELYSDMNASRVFILITTAAGG